MKIKYNMKKINSLIAAVGITGSLAVGAINFGFHLNRENHLPDFYYLNTKNIDLDSEDLLVEFDSIYSRSEELQKYWDEIYPELSDFILKYGSYLDQEEILDTLPDLKINVLNSVANSKNVLAITNSTDVSINLNERLFYKKAEEIKETLLHEAFHYLFQQNFSNAPLHNQQLGRQLDEGIAALLTREYGCYSGVDIYEKSVNYVRVICELIGPEKYMEATGHHDISELIEYISEYCDRKDAVSLLKSIDKACIYYDSKTEDDETAWNIINKIYLNKNKVSIEESTDLVMKIYSNKLLGTSYNIDGSREENHAHLTKNYFINTDKAYITYIQSGKEYGCVTLNEENEIETGSILVDGFYSENGNVISQDGNIIPEKIINYNEETMILHSK